jgi:hypothetical protein
VVSGETGEFDDVGLGVESDVAETLVDAFVAVEAELTESITSGLLEGVIDVMPLNMPASFMRLRLLAVAAPPVSSPAPRSEAAPTTVQVFVFMMFSLSTRPRGCGPSWIPCSSAGMR